MTSLLDTASAEKPSDAPLLSLGGGMGGRVLLNFAASIAASWIASPLGVIFLHLAGYGTDPNLVSLLLLTSAAAPFQLLCNEYLAASASKSHVSPTMSQIAVILAGQIAVTFVVGGAFGEGQTRLAPVPRVALCAMLAASTWFSYAVAVRYYAVTLCGKIGYRHSIVVGALPGFITLLLYLVAGFSRITFVILLAALAPAIVQLLYVRSLPGARADGASRHPSWTLLIVATILLGLAATANALVRGEIGFLDQRFIALILTGLNLIGTMVLMVGRASYLTGGAQGRPMLRVTAGSLCVLGLLLFPVFRPAALLLTFLGLQLGVAAIIAHMRRRTISPSPAGERNFALTGDAVITNAPQREQPR